MKRFPHRFCSFAIVFTLVLTLLVPMACAALDASAYFAATDAVAYAEEDGKILIEADACATDIMEEVGVKSITIYEKQSDGNYDDVHTYTRYNTSGMISTNDYSHFKSLTYQGTIGTKYYAEIAFYAKDSDGSETLCYDTNVVTAVATP